jgi:CubicO group peptidase (beta-lactamase class C family)
MHAMTDLKSIAWMKLLRACLPLGMLFLLTSTPSLARDTTAPGAATGRVTITITKTPERTPANAHIYVSGNFNEWRPDVEQYRMLPQGDGKYALTLPAGVTGHIEYKFTLGTWSKGETKRDGSDISNRSAEIPASGLANLAVEVEAWRLPPQTIAELRSTLESVLKRHGLPGLSVAVVRHGEVELAAGFGLADIASKRPATQDTLFRIGSVSKNFVALAIMQLANEGKLSLMDPVRKWLPEVAFENRWESTDPVRIVDLLEHTTGWDDIHFKEYAKSGHGLDLRQALEYGKNSRVSRWRPGTRFAYCNSGPAVAALIVEKISGQRFETYAQSRLFGPIGMTTATFLQPPDPLKAVTLYHRDGKSPYPYREIIFNEAGSVNASAKDMAAYLMFYLQRGGSVMSPATIARIETPTRSFGSREGLGIGYGLYNTGGLIDGLVYRGHDGSIDGASSSFTYLTSHGTGYFYSTSSQNGPAISEIEQALRAYISADITRNALPAKSAMPADAATYAGWYELVSPREQWMYFFERLVRLSKLDVTADGVHLKGVSRQELDLVPAGGRTLRFANAPVATSALVAPNSEGQFIVIDSRIMQRIPTWQAYVEIGLVAWVVLAFVVVVLYAPFWLITSMFKRWRRPQELPLKLLPLFAIASVFVYFVTMVRAGEDYVDLLGRLTLVSATTYLCTIAFALVSLWCAKMFWTTRKAPFGRVFKAYAILTTSALLISAAYGTYWGFIGWRTWA